MPVAALLVVLLAGGAAAYYWRRQPAFGPGQQLPQPGLPTKLPELNYPVRPPKGINLGGIGSKLDKMLADLEQDPSKSPQDVAKVAKQAQKRGLSLQALRLGQNVAWRVKALGGIPHVLKAGDTAAGLAAKYTGDALRFAELEGRPVEPGGVLVAYKDGNGWAQFKPWKVGQRITLPPTWGEG